MRSQRSPGSASRSLGSPSRLSDHDLIALSARDPEAAQLELGVREALGIASPHSVHNAVAVGVAGLNYDIRFAPHLTDAELERERQREAERVDAAAEHLAYAALTRAATSVSQLRLMRLMRFGEGEHPYLGLVDQPDRLGFSPPRSSPPNPAERSSSPYLAQRSSPPHLALDFQEAQPRTADLAEGRKCCAFAFFGGLQLAILGIVGWLLYKDSPLAHPAPISPPVLPSLPRTLL